MDDDRPLLPETISPADVDEILRIVDNSIRFPTPTTAELVDEDDPNSLVVVKDVTGQPFAWMPRDVYERLRTGPQS